MMRAIYRRHSLVYGRERKDPCRMTMPRTPAFGELLKQYRLAAGLTQEELAERARMSVRAVGDLERGMRRAPHKDTLRLLADALNLCEDDRALLFESVRSSRRTAVSSPPPARALAPPKGLPAILTPLIGREREEAAIAHVMRQDDVRLLTLTGPAGIGKTRLATQVALELSAHFASVVFVSLASVRDAALVTPVIAQALGLHEQPNLPVMEQLTDHLSGRKLLLVLDNFEQVVQAGRIIAQLLAACPHVKALVTSRVGLSVRGEHEFAVPPLDTPDLAQLPSLEDLTRFPDVTLFVQRAQAIKPTFAVTPALAPVIAAMCARLDGIPLALELAAARIKLFPPRALLERLDESLALLTNGPADLPERQQTMRRAIDWSYQLLGVSEQCLFRRLAVFVDGWTLEAAEMVCCGDDLPMASVIDGLTHLVDSSLIVQEERDDDQLRFRLLQLIREFGWEQLGAHGEASQLRSRHAEYYLALAETAAPEMRGPNQGHWLACLAQEHSNLRTALEWARETQSIEHGLRLGSALYSFWRLHGHASEGRVWLERFLALQQPLESDRDKMVRADALRGAGYLACVQADHETARALLVESLELYRVQRNKRGTAQVLNTQGMIANERGEYAQAVVLFEESLALWRELGDMTWIGALLNDLAVVAFRQERYPEAISLLEEGLALHRAAHDHWSTALTLCNLGEAMRMEGDLTTATRLLEEGLEVQRELGDKGVMATPLLNLADVAREQGDLERAARLTYEALATASEVGPKFAVVDALDGTAEVVYSRGRIALATQIYGLAAFLREANHIPRPAGQAKVYATRIEELRTRLDEAEFTSAWEQGRRWSLDEAVQLLSAPKTETASQNVPASARSWGA
jgi:predicted ATPase/transcriptional regulator with XRE-family HTH domain